MNENEIILKIRAEEEQRRKEIHAGLCDVMSKQDQRIEALENALRLILPLAKGYAAKHNVGSNAQFVCEAEWVLRKYFKNDSKGHLKRSTKALYNER